MSLIAIFLIVFLSGLVIFQISLAFGAPFGKVAWGGQHDAALPQKLRISSAISAVFLLFIISVILSFTGSISLYTSSFEMVFLWFTAIYFGIGIIMNAISRSKIERIWSPYSAVLCVLLIILLTQGI